MAGLAPSSITTTPTAKKFPSRSHGFDIISFSRTGPAVTIAGTETVCAGHETGKCRDNMNGTGISKRGVLLMVAVAAVGFAVVILCYIFGPAAVQERNMALAQAHGDRLKLSVGADPRFKCVQFDALADEQLTVHGYVASDENLKELTRLVDASGSPRPVEYVIAVSPEIFALVTNLVTSTGSNLIPVNPAPAAESRDPAY